MNILVACEESQQVCKAFRKLGFNAYSCDITPCSGGYPEYHLLGDALDVIKNKGGKTQLGLNINVPKWDMMIAHPPCTYLSISGASWFYHPEDKYLPKEKRRPHPKFPNRKNDREKAVEFFMALINADIEHIALENPVGVMNKIYKKPSQIVQPYFFGNSAEKKTCLWLKNLPLLEPTNIVNRGERVKFKSGRSMALWCSTIYQKNKNPKERQRLRSITFPGSAKAIAEQWGSYLKKLYC